jgi:hypothetical protein
MIDAGHGDVLRSSIESHCQAKPGLPVSGHPELRADLAFDPGVISGFNRRERTAVTRHRPITALPVSR